MEYLSSDFRCCRCHDHVIIYIALADEIFCYYRGIYYNIVIHLKSYDEQNRENCIHNNIITTYIHPRCMYIHLVEQTPQGRR